MAKEKIEFCVKRIAEVELYRDLSGFDVRGQPPKTGLVGVGWRAHC